MERPGTPRTPLKAAGRGVVWRWVAGTPRRLRHRKTGDTPDPAEGAHVAGLGVGGVRGVDLSSSPSPPRRGEGMLATRGEPCFATLVISDAS